MKYVFFGTPRFAEIVLGRMLDAGMPPAALVCNPDRPVGRKKTMTAPETKKLAARGTIAVLQPETLDENFIKELAAFAPDVFVVAAYAKIIPPAVLAIPRLGTLGVHPSLLPKYRGASPIQSAILGGETETGVTIYRVDEKVDHGGILAADRLPLLAGETYRSLEEKLAALGGTLLVDVMPKFFAGEIRPQPQDESRATLTKKFRTEDGFVAPFDLAAAVGGDEGKAIMIDRTIRALNPEPGVWTLQNGKRVKLLESKIQNGTLRLTVVQREGEKPKKQY